MNEGDDNCLEAIIRLADRFSEVAVTAFQGRWEALEVSIYEPEFYEVVGGLVSRQATICSFLARSPISWNPHVAPLLLRAMVEVHINFSWILLDPVPRADLFVSFGIGQEKLLLAHLRQLAQENPQRAPELEGLIENKKAWIGTHKHEFLAEVDLGSWSGKSLRDMAVEADCEELYSLDYRGYSGSVHSMWQHLSIWNLEHCLNPLHKLHRVAGIQPAYLDELFLVDSARYLSRTLGAFDDHFELSPQGSMPISWLIAELDKLAAASEGGIDS